MDARYRLSQREANIRLDNLLREYARVVLENQQLKAAANVK